VRPTSRRFQRRAPGHPGRRASDSDPDGVLPRAALPRHRRASPARSFDLDAVTGTALRGVDPVDVYERPFKQVWTALSKGEPLDDASSQGAHRLETLIKTDLQLARTHTVRECRPSHAEVSVHHPRAPGRVRLRALHRRLHSALHEARPPRFIPAVTASSRLVTADYDPGQVIDEAKLEQIHDAVEAALGDFDRGGRASTTERSS
jgi:hypothetical protein